MDNVRSRRLGMLVKRWRTGAGLTQRELAERARLSLHTVANLERNAGHLPRADTLALLATALQLDETQRAELLATFHDQPVEQQTCSPARSSANAWPVHPLTALIGRARELEVARALLARRDARLITVTGTSGVGKTRFAIELCRRYSADRWGSDTIYPVFLATCSSPTHALARIAQTLGMDDASAEVAGVDGLVRHLQATNPQEHLILMLDTVEHLSGIVPDLVKILVCCANVRLLITSRKALRVRGEILLRLLPLPIPQESTCAPASIAQVPAVALFVDRARGADPSFVLSDAVAPHIAAICRRLDGLPLAIELAAARLLLFSPRELVAQLDHHLTLLAHGPCDLPARQRSLEGSLGWSYNLLSDQARIVFRCLSVFGGEWTIGMATHLVLVRTHKTADTRLWNEEDILTAHEELLDHHLIFRRSETGTHPDHQDAFIPEFDPGVDAGLPTAMRFGMLRTTCDFARHCLAQCSE